MSVSVGQKRTPFCALQACPSGVGSVSAEAMPGAPSGTTPATSMHPRTLAKRFTLTPPLSPDINRWEPMYPYDEVCNAPRAGLSADAAPPRSARQGENVRSGGIDAPVEKIEVGPLQRLRSTLVDHSQPAGGPLD